MTSRSASPSDSRRVSSLEAPRTRARRRMDVLTTHPPRARPRAVTPQAHVEKETGAVSIHHESHVKEMFDTDIHHLIKDTGFFLVLLEVSELEEIDVKSFVPLLIMDAMHMHQVRARADSGRRTPDQQGAREILVRHRVRPVPFR